MEGKRKTLGDLVKMKKKGEKVTWITSYDFQTARIAEESGVDMILVGDSAGNNLLGYENTIPVTMDEMIMLTKAVRRGAPNTFIVGDMPLGSYQISNENATFNALRFMKEAGVDAVKLEGGERVTQRVKALKDAGIATIGHIGYTPQSTDLMGVVQSKSLDGFKTLYNDSKALQDAGACAILLEAVPNEPAGYIAKSLNIPVYGIGAGKNVDGILAIVNDVVGLGGIKAKFVKQFSDVGSEMKKGLSSYVNEIRSGSFPEENLFYKISEDNLNEIKNYIQSLDSKK